MKKRTRKFQRHSRLTRTFFFNTNSMEKIENKTETLGKTRAAGASRQSSNFPSSFSRPEKEVSNRRRKQDGEALPPPPPPFWPWAADETIVSPSFLFSPPRHKHAGLIAQGGDRSTTYYKWKIGPGTPLGFPQRRAIFSSFFLTQGKTGNSFSGEINFYCTNIRLRKKHSFSFLRYVPLLLFLFVRASFVASINRFRFYTGTLSMNGVTN